MRKLLILISFTFIGCKSFSDYTNQKVVLKKDALANFDLKDNQIILSLNVNNSKGAFLFDTGASKSVITDGIYMSKMNLNKENYYNSAKVKNATLGFIESNNFISDSIENDLFTGQNVIFKHIVIEKTASNCLKEINVSNGIIGFDIFKNAAKPIILNFEENTISVLNNNYSIEGYQKLKTKLQLLTGNKLQIPLLIDGVETKFLFDTGNNGGLLLKAKDCKINSQKLFLDCQSLVGTVSGYSIENIKGYQNVSLQYDNFIDETVKISVFTRLTTNTLGIAFIKNFNWILDFENGNVFFKQISKISEVQNSKPEILNFKSYALNDKLLIAFKNMTLNSNLNVGDQIISLNNQIITSANICEMQDLLNNTQDWNTLNIEIKKLPN